MELFIRALAVLLLLALSLERERGLVCESVIYISIPYGGRENTGTTLYSADAGIILLARVMERCMKLLLLERLAVIDQCN